MFCCMLVFFCENVMPNVATDIGVMIKKIEIFGFRALFFGVFIAFELLDFLVSLINYVLLSVFVCMKNKASACKLLFS